LPPLIKFTKKGIYCPEANFYIDPWSKVDKAVITHAHSDHARKGHNSYLSHNDSVGILKYRLGQSISIQGVAYNKKININGVDLSFHPAGHIVGSSQIRIANKKEVWVISGDYKLENDNLSQPFEPVKCDFFVTESTFGLPVFQWKKQESVFNEINSWWSKNVSVNRPSLISAYSLGKAQRIIQNVDHSIGPIYTHGAIENTNQVLRESGINIKETTLIADQSKSSLNKGLIICPPSALGSAWVNKFKNPSLAMASGWMATRGNRRRRNADIGFVLSDHADWNDLNKAVKLTEAKKIFVTHGYSDIYSKWLNHQGIESQTVETAFESEGPETQGVI